MDDVTQDRELDRDSRYAEMPTMATTGVWACDLATEALTWSPGVYDLFGFARDSVLDRAETASRYTPGSRVALECLRVAAIRDKTGFTLDAEIEVEGQSRWIRIVARVECVDGKATRLVGSKSDITHERRAGVYAIC